MSIYVRMAPAKFLRYLIFVIIVANLALIAYVFRHSIIPENGDDSAVSTNLPPTNLGTN